MKKNSNIFMPNINNHINLIMRSSGVSLAKKAGSIILCREHKRHDSYYNYQILML